LFAEELWGYTVYVWDFIDRNFIEQVIPKDLLNPRLHRFFSYKNWRAEQTGRKRKHREWERERKNKRQRTEASMSNNAVIKCGMNRRKLLIGGMGNGLDLR